MMEEGTALQQPASTREPAMQIEVGWHCCDWPRAGRLASHGRAGTHRTAGPAEDLCCVRMEHKLCSARSLRTDPVAFCFMHGAVPVALCDPPSHRGCAGRSAKAGNRVRQADLRVHVVAQGPDRALEREAWARRLEAQPGMELMGTADMVVAGKSLVPKNESFNADVFLVRLLRHTQQATGDLECMQKDAFRLRGGLHLGKWNTLRYKLL